MNEHRKIWIESNGDIPKDHNGQSYEIHHINGDHSDNRLDNLICVSIREHFDIHLKQGDMWSAQQILGRMAKSEEEYEEMRQRFSLGGENHPMYGRNHTEEAKHKIGIASAKRNKGAGNPMFGKNHSKESRKKMSEQTKGRGLGVPKSLEQRKKMSNAVNWVLTCPHCGKSARGNSMRRWHFDNCKHKNDT